MRFYKSLAVAALALPLCGLGVAAAATPQVNPGYASYKQKLDSGEIMPLGGKRAGNADGTIPAWKCNADGTPPGIDVAPGSVDTHTYPAMKNPFAGEKPRFVITAQNYQQYADKLSPGTVKLLKQYPDDFRIPVYPTHRTSCFSDTLYKQTALNARYGKLIDDGNGVSHVYMAPPFPLPDNGLQAVWNNLIGENVWHEQAYYTGIAIFDNGSRKHNETDYEIYSKYNDPAVDRDKWWSKSGKHLQVGYLQKAIKPERTRGTIQVGVGYLRKTVNRRDTWQYLPGTRRVRRYPYFGYDTPQGAGGLRGIDEDRLFNGAPDRFNWKLGKVKEMFVPYNAYVMDSAKSYDQLLGKHALNPAFTRWELHRVRVLTATLKPGARHWYKKRVLYIDEDTHHALLADNYDHHGNLWRTSQQNYVWTPILKDAVLARAAVYYDFEAGAYVAQRLINENPRDHNPTLNINRPSEDHFSPSEARRMGHR